MDPRGHTIRTVTHPVAGEVVRINVVEHPDDLPLFRDFIGTNKQVLGVDSETSGLDIYNAGFKLRTVQFGNRNEAWVVPAELGPQFESDIRIAIGYLDKLIFHNASFDLQVFEKTLGIGMTEMWPKVVDTKILAHLVDPRGREEGGFGHSLEECTRHYIDPEVANGVKTLMADLAREHKTTKAKIWSVVDITNARFQLYAGMDPVLAFRLWEKLRNQVPSSARKLITYERELARVCAEIEKTGFLLDVEYTQRLSEKLLWEQEHWQQVAADLGLENINSPVQVAEALTSAGVKIKGRTPTGNPKVDSELLGRLREGDPTSIPALLATAISEGKKAGKWRKTWVQKFLDTRDPQNRCHASINPLRARTARMSITGIPAQTLPASDSTIRRCFIADPGELIASVVYEAQELRVLAALSGDRTMIDAFAHGEDLHLMTARAAFGEHVQKDDPERKYAKTVNFGRVYGGGYATVAAQTGLSVRVAKTVVDGFDKTYPQVGELSSRLALEAKERGFVVTPVGRKLPVDKDRGYSALNYLIQSASRDITGTALLRLDEAGYTPYIRLPIHDEILLSLPEQHAERAAKHVGRIMTQQIGPVCISTDPEVGGTSWGSLYEKDKGEWHWVADDKAAS